MSKKYKGKTCVYCNNAQSDSPDHVFAREFFLPNDRNNLPEVPACNLCNSEKSKLEHYFTAILPFGGRHPVAKTNLEKMVPKRLKRNVKLHKYLNQSYKKTWIKEKNDLMLQASGFSFDTDKLEKLLTMIIKGLVWYHWEKYLTSEHFIEIYFLTKYGELIFENQIFSIKSCNRVNGDLGNKTVVYEGLQDSECPEMTAWRIFFYGGMILSEQSSSNEVSSCICSFTGPNSIKKK